MTSELEHAVRAYRRSEKAYTARRRELQDAMMRATDAGIAQTQICKVTGWTREQVRKMVAIARKRAAGGEDGGRRGRTGDTPTPDDHG